ncbi:HAMP domain-containing sensor histidine kinase [Pseudomarimonas arenosa]|uniref:sensor histidine kinase n=1 Tax=Pseudomarimonas arenosa TaxID=2774145 RepID=UPI002FC38A59
MLTNQLRRAAQSYPDLTLNLQGYDAVGSLPESLREWAQSDPEAGLYEFESEQLHVAVVTADNAQGRAFVVLDVTGIEAASSEDWWLLLVITSVVGALGTLGFALGLVVMRRAVAPVAQLAKVVAEIDLQHLSDGDHRRIDSGRFGDDEVGMLAATIEKTLERISAFVARERYFTGSASHELRTPITVITGALELLEQSDLSPADAMAVERARRATLEMKATVEMFLCLAREIDDGLYDEQFLVMPMVSQAVDQQRYLLSGKCVDVVVNELATPRVCGHPQAFFIALNNLVRNAFEQTLDGQGPIKILINAHELLVTNQVSADDDGQPGSIEPASPHGGYGLGLGIVQRLCERNGWLFTLHADETRVVARLSWQPIQTAKRTAS